MQRYTDIVPVIFEHINENNDNNKLTTINKR